jgi:alpha-amylase
MNLSAIGMAQPLESHILDFLKALPACAAQRGITFSTPSEVIDNHKSVGSLEVPYPLSWMDEERDASSWLGNTLQREAFNKLYSVAERIMLTDDKKLKQDFDYLQAAENLRFMTTKQNGIITERCIYESPYDAFTNYMNILGDFLARVRAQYPDMDNEELGALQQMIENQEVEIVQLEAEVEQLKTKLATKEKKAAKKVAEAPAEEAPVAEEKPKRKCGRKPKAE